MPAYATSTALTTKRGLSSSPERNGRLIFWFGLLGVFTLLFAQSFTLSNFTLYRVSDAVVTLLYLGVLAVTGWLHRRPGAVLPVAVVLLVLGGFVLVLPDMSLSIGLWWYSNEPFLTTVSLTLVFGAWLVVRRVTGALWALLVPVAAVEYLWLRVVTKFMESLSDAVYLHAFWPVTLVGGTAVLAAGALLVERLRADDPPPSALSYGPAPVQPAQMGSAGLTGWPPSSTDVQAYGASPWRQPRVPAATVPPAPWGYGPAPGRVNTLAVVALILGIVGVSLGGIICGHIALAQIRRTSESGRGMAVAGLVLGYLWVAILVIALLVAASGASSSGY